MVGFFIEETVVFFSQRHSFCFLFTCFTLDSTSLGLLLIRADEKLKLVAYLRAAAGRHACSP